MYKFKKGTSIHIKSSNKGKFTDYCGGKVTQECIDKGKHSKNPKIRKRATFAENARKWKHAKGGKAFVGNINVLDSNPKAYKEVKKRISRHQEGGIINGITGLISAFKQSKEIKSQIQENTSDALKLKQDSRQRVYDNLYNQKINDFQKQQQAFQQGEIGEQPSDIVLRHSVWDKTNLLSNQLNAEIDNELRNENLRLKQQKDAIVQSGILGFAQPIINKGSATLTKYLENKYSKLNWNNLKNSTKFTVNNNINLPNDL